ncbi:hypothetical protein RUND412_008724 [Rhizina undulata]
MEATEKPPTEETKAEEEEFRIEFTPEDHARGEKVWQFLHGHPILERVKEWNLDHSTSSQASLASGLDASASGCDKAKVPRPLVHRRDDGGPAGHGRKVGELPCPIAGCGRSYVTEASIRRHIRDSHSK